MENKPLADRLDKLLRRCWESDPQKRFKNGSELLAAWPSTAGATPPPTPKQSSRQGDLAISTSHDADIYLDGKSRGQTEGRYLLIEKIPYGEHQLKAENRTQIAEKTFKQDKEMVQVDLELKAKTGRLKVSSKIGFFNFSIQGTSYKAPKVLTNVTVGEHELNISHKELKFSRKIQVKANQTAEFLLTREMLKQEKQRADEKAIADLLAAPEGNLGEKKAKYERLVKSSSNLQAGELRDRAEYEISRLAQEIRRAQQRREEEEREKRGKKRKKILRFAVVFVLVIAVVTGYSIQNQIKKRDDRAFESAREVGTEEALREYMANYELHIEKAKSQLSKLQESREQEERDHEAYARACKAGSEEALREYLSKYKLHVSEAKELISELQRGLQAGGRKSIRIPGTTIDLNMRWIPSGSFTMGGKYEKPQHRATLSKGFWMLETEVTQEMWKALMGPESNPSKFEGAKRPVEQVNWHEAKEFIEKLNSKGIGTYRLPTEAEWEYACRAGSPYAYCYGDGESKLKDYAWYGEGETGKTHTVGGKQPNDWGLYDMHGNVYEWCEDVYGDYPVSPQTDPRGPASGEYRVSRGGSFWDFARGCRSAYRYWDTPDYRFRNLGFRLARNYP